MDVLEELRRCSTAYSERERARCEKEKAANDKKNAQARLRRKIRYNTDPEYRAKIIAQERARRDRRLATMSDEEIVEDKRIKAERVKAYRMTHPYEGVKSYPTEKKNMKKEEKIVLRPLVRPLIKKEHCECIGVDGKPKTWCMHYVNGHCVHSECIIKEKKYDEKRI